MKLARSRRELVIGVILLLILAAVTMVAIDERLSMQLDAVDLTWEEASRVR